MRTHPAPGLVMHRLLIAVLAVTAACAPDPADVTPDTADNRDVSGTAFTDAPPPGEEQLVITSQDGAVDLGLTDQVVYFRLSPKKRAEIEEEMAAETEEAGGGLGGFITETVTGAVGGLLGRAIQVPVDDVEVTHDGDGHLDIRSADGGTVNVDIGGDDGEPAFDPDDAERFSLAFERVRSRRAGA